MKTKRRGRAAAADGIRTIACEVLLNRVEATTIRRRAALSRLPVSVYVRELALHAGQPLAAVPVLNIRIAGRLALLASDVRHLVCLAQKGRIAPDLLPALLELAYRSLREAERTVEDLTGLAPLPAALRLEDVAELARRRDVFLAAESRSQHLAADPESRAAERLEAAAACRTLRDEGEDYAAERGLPSPTGWPSWRAAGPSRGLLASTAEQPPREAAREDRELIEDQARARRRLADARMAALTRPAASHERPPRLAAAVQATVRAELALEERLWDLRREAHGLCKARERAEEELAAVERLAERRPSPASLATSSRLLLATADLDDRLAPLARRLAHLDAHRQARGPDRLERGPVQIDAPDLGHGLASFATELRAARREVRLCGRELTQVLSAAEAARHAPAPRPDVVERWREALSRRDRAESALARHMDAAERRACSAVSGVPARNARDLDALLGRVRRGDATPETLSCLHRAVARELTAANAPSPGLARSVLPRPHPAPHQAGQGPGASDHPAPGASHPLARQGPGSSDQIGQAPGASAPARQGPGVSTSAGQALGGAIHPAASSPSEKPGMAETLAASRADRAAVLAGVRAVERARAPRSALPGPEIAPVLPPLPEMPVRLPLTEAPARPRLTEAPAHPPLTEAPARSRLTEAPARPPLPEAPARPLLTEAPVRPRLPEREALERLGAALGRCRASAAELHRRTDLASPGRQRLLPVEIFLRHPGCERAPHLAVLAWSAHAAREGLDPAQAAEALARTARPRISALAALSPAFARLAAEIGVGARWLHLPALGAPWLRHAAYPEWRLLALAALASGAVAISLRFRPARPAALLALPLLAPLYLAALTPVYPPLALLRWSARYGAVAPLAADLRRARWLLLAAFSALAAPALARALARLRDLSESGDSLGSSHWATRREVRAAGLLGGIGRGGSGGGVVVGAWPDGRGRLHRLRDRRDRHVLAFAPSGSGKSSSLIIPTLLEWPCSVVVLDIKGELWHRTAGFRDNGLGNLCLRFDPSARGGAAARYNPLLVIPRGAEDVKHAQGVADVLVDPDGKDRPRTFWERSAHSLLVGAILHVLYAGKDKSLAGCAQLLSDPGRPVQQTLKVMLHTRHDPELRMGWLDAKKEKTPTHPAVAAAARTLLDMDPRTSSGVIATAQSHLDLFRDPILAANTATSDFTAADLVRGERPVSLYLTLPPGELDRLRGVVRMALNQLCRQLTEGLDFVPQARPARPLLLLLDEFAALGKLDFFGRAMAYLRGYGIRVFISVQALNQLLDIYGPHQSITANCPLQVAFAPADVPTAELVSKMTGAMTVNLEKRSWNAGAAAGRRASSWRHELARPLLTVEEVRRLPDDEALVFCPGHAPIRARRLPYFRDPVLAERAAVPPPPTSGRLERDWAAWTAWQALPPSPGLLSPPPPLPTARDLDKIGS